MKFKLASKGALSINIIVVAAIAMIILVIITFLIFQTGGDIQEGTSCEALQGVCVEESVHGSCSQWAEDTGESRTWIRDRTGRCSSDNQICCKPLGVS